MAKDSSHMLDLAKRGAALRLHELATELNALLQDAGVEPDVWKIEGLDRREECERIVEAARRGGRMTVGCIVLGPGSDEQAVVRWLKIAAGVPGFIGFAVGRTTWLDAVTAWRAHTISRDIAVARIAKRFREWAAIFEHVSVR
jgi:myo-inositol catabolism protein IolC